jgi:excisionase family DNA binding protein
MGNFLTTRQLQDILQIDRTTIYRMADNGRLPALKVGNQWRFPRQEVETWLKTQHASLLAEDLDAGPASRLDVRQLLPLECVQLIQDTFADMLGVMLVITDLEGQPITQVSHPCGLYTASEASPMAHTRCVELWAKLARDPSLQPRFVESPLGLLCARALIRTGGELGAMLVASGVAPRQWPPDAARMAEITAYLELPADVVTAKIDEVFIVGLSEQQELLAFLQRIADIVAHIIMERNKLYSKLQSIAELSRF